MLVGLICAVSAAHVLAIHQFLSNSSQTTEPKENKPVISAILLPARPMSPTKVTVPQKLNKKAEKKKITKRQPSKKQKTTPLVKNKHQTVPVRPSKREISTQAAAPTHAANAQTLTPLMAEANNDEAPTSTSTSTSRTDRIREKDAPIQPPALVPPQSKAPRLHNPPPIYPRTSLRLREQGKVVLHLLVLADGSVDQLSVKQSSQHPRLDKAALRAVRKWRYLPATLAGKKINFWHEQSIVFSLRNK